MRQLYCALLSLYPAEHRAVFEEEMLAAFDQGEQECRGQSGGLRFFFRELAGLMRGLSAEWMLRLSGGAGYLDRRAAATLRSDLPAELMHAQRHLRLVLNRMEHAIAHHDFPNARLLAYEEQETRQSVRELFRKYNLEEQT